MAGGQFGIVPELQRLDGRRCRAADRRKHEIPRRPPPVGDLVVEHQGSPVRRYALDWISRDCLRSASNIASASAPNRRSSTTASSSKLTATPSGLKSVDPT